ncbi:hypothetical protein CFP56_038587 [Quercus suber]|uniref:Uncharacterized protein n=1 Tax=Quercus suber TaxID=58331 RepID=A0AAW0LNL9_QUESU
MGLILIFSFGYGAFIATFGAWRKMQESIHFMWSQGNMARGKREGDERGFFITFYHFVIKSSISIRTTKSLQNHGGDLARRGEGVGVVGEFCPSSHVTW